MIKRTIISWDKDVSYPTPIGEHILKFSREIGFKPTPINSRLGPKKVINHYLDLVKSWKTSDIILTAYPNIMLPIRLPVVRWLRYLDSYMFKSLNKDKTTILYVYDLPIEQALSVRDNMLVDDISYELERLVFEQFDWILVFNKRMKKYLRNRYGISHDKIVEYKILDYYVPIAPPAEKRLDYPVNIAFIANLDRKRVEDIPLNLPHSVDIKYHFMGKNGEWIKNLKRNDFVYHGFIPHKSLPNELFKMHFGILMYPDPVSFYLRFSASSKFSAYVTAGLPLLVNYKSSYPAELVKKYKIGFIFKDPEDILKIIDQLSDSKYQKIRQNVLKLAEKIRRGYFIKHALKEVLNKNA